MIPCLTEPVTVNQDGTLAMLSVHLPPSVNVTHFNHGDFQVWMKPSFSSEWQLLKLYTSNREPLSNTSSLRSTSSLPSSRFPIAGSRLNLEAILPVNRDSNAVAAFKVVSVMSKHLSLSSNEVENVDLKQIRTFLPSAMQHIICNNYCCSFYMYSQFVGYTDKYNFAYINVFRTAKNNKAGCTFEGLFLFEDRNSMAFRGSTVSPIF